MSLEMLIESDWMRVGSVGLIDSQKAFEEQDVIRGVILAEEGPFKDGRGQFTANSIHRLGTLTLPSEGIKSRLAHPNLSDDGVGKYLGRYKDKRVIQLEDGRLAFVADLHFNESAKISPNGDLAAYVTSRAKTDPNSFGNSIVGHHKFFDPDTGDELSRNEMFERIESAPNTTVWMPISLHASDVVDTGNATTAFFQSGLEKLDQLPDGGVRVASKVLDQVFADQTRDVVEARGQAFLTRYLDNRFGRAEMSEATNTTTTETAPATTAPAEPAVDKQAIIDEANKLASDRATRIAQLCTTAGCPDESAKYISDAKLSAVDVQELLFQKMAKQNTLSEETEISETTGTTKTPDDKLREEYDRESLTYKRMGVTFEQFKASETKELERGKLGDLAVA